MNTVQKILVSATTIASFSFYAFFLRTQDAQLTAIAPTIPAEAIAQQTTASGAVPPPSADAQAFIDQINAAAAKNRAVKPKPSVVSDEREYEDDEEEDGRIVVTRSVSSAAAQQPAQRAPLKTQTPPATQSPAPVAQTAKPAGQYKDGSYTGPSVNVFYGYVQVEAVIQNGKLADVRFLQYPSDRSTSVYINTTAMPLLKQEAIRAQSAQVDGVSGASATSGGFIQSLTDALSQAHV